jgi:hypothetical protein
MFRWDGSNWRSLPASITAGMPTPLLSAYDFGRRRLRVIASRPTSVHALPHVLWDLAEEPLTVDQPYPRPGESLTFSVDLQGEASRTWLLGLSLGAGPGVPLIALPGLGWQVLPLQSDELLTASLSVPLSGVLDAAGKGSMTLAVPQNPWLIGFDLHAAAFTLGAGPTVRSITNRQPFTIVK